MQKEQSISTGSGIPTNWEMKDKGLHHSKKLLDALEATPSARMQKLKALFAVELKSMLYPSYKQGIEARLHNVYHNSPICRPNNSAGVKLNRTTLAELKDFVPWEVLAALLAAPVLEARYAVTLTEVLDAIADPDATGVKGGRAAHGYRFGMPARMGQHLGHIRHFTRFIALQLRQSIHNEENGGAIIAFSRDGSKVIEPEETKNDVPLSSMIAATLALTSVNWQAEYDENIEQDGDMAEVPASMPHAITALDTLMAHHTEALEVRAAIGAGVNLILEKGGNMGEYVGCLDEEALALFHKCGGVTATIDVVDTTNDLVIDPSFAPMVNALMRQVTKGKFATLDEMAAKLNESTALTHVLADQLRDAQDAVVTIKQIPVPTIPTIDASGIITTWEMKDAGEVFRTPAGKVTKKLNFNIPVFSHRDDQGQVVTHPLVPDLDPDYIPRLSLTIKFLLGMIFGSNIYLPGHTGTGKSTLPMWIAAMINMPLIRVNLDSFIERADLTGENKLVEENGATVSKWVDGVIPQAMRIPCMLLLDEIDAAKQDALFVIQRALEGKGILLTENGGELVRPHPLFRFVGTGNTKGQGDEYGCYIGTNQINLATLDRFNAWIEVDYLDAKDEETLLTSKCPTVSPDIIQRIVQFGKELRKAFINGEADNTVSPRGLISMASYYEMYSQIAPKESDALAMAFDMTILTRTPLQGRQRVIELATATFGTAIGSL